MLTGPKEEDVDFLAISGIVNFYNEVFNLFPSQSSLPNYILDTHLGTPVVEQTCSVVAQ
jgi:hypothetical protein